MNFGEGPLEMSTYRPALTPWARDWVGVTHLTARSMQSPRLLLIVHSEHRRRGAASRLLKWSTHPIPLPIYLQGHAFPPHGVQRRQESARCLSQRGGAIPIRRSSLTMPRRKVAIYDSSTAMSPGRKALSAFCIRSWRRCLRSAESYMSLQSLR